MDTPVTRTKEQMIGHYVDGLMDYLDFNPAHILPVRVVLGLMYNEAKEQFRRDIGLQDSHIAELERQMRALQTKLQDIEAKQATTISAAIAIPLNGTTISHDHAESPTAPAEPRRRGRKPDSAHKRGPYKKKGATADEIARQLEGAVVRDAPTVGRIDQSLISDDSNGIPLNGTLRREEQLITTQHGMPVRVTRQYIEIR